MKQEEDLYIEILKHGKEKIENGVSFNELFDFINSKHSWVTRVFLVMHFQEIFEVTDDDEQRYSGNKHILGECADMKGRLSLESYFKLIEYEELKEARETSQSAMTRSTIAISISIAAMLIGSLLSIYQINTPTKLDKLTINELKNIKYDDDVINRSIGSIDKKQDVIIKELKETNISINKANKTLNSDAQKTRAR